MMNQRIVKIWWDGHQFVVSATMWQDGKNVDLGGEYHDTILGVFNQLSNPNFANPSGGRFGKVDIETFLKG
jgi:hypothetical protein